METLIDWDKLVNNLASISANENCCDEEGNEFTVIEVIQRELQPVKDEIKQLRDALQNIADVHHGNIQGQVAAKAIGDV